MRCYSMVYVRSPELLLIIYDLVCRIVSLHAVEWELRLCKMYIVVYLLLVGRLHYTYMSPEKISYTYFYFNYDIIVMFSILSKNSTERCSDVEQGIIVAWRLNKHLYQAWYRILFSKSFYKLSRNVFSSLPAKASVQTRRTIIMYITRLWCSSLLRCICIKSFLL